MDKGNFLILCISMCTVPYALGQQLSVLNDKEYLDNIQSEIEINVRDAKADLVEHAKEVETATKTYAAAKLTHNIFKALRDLAEKELEAIPMKDRIRQPRQDAEEEAGGDDEENTATSASVSGATFAPNRNESLIPVLAGILKSVFGGENGTQPLNVTHTLQTASKIIFKPFERPFNGLSNLIGRLRPTPAPAPPVKYYPVPVYPEIFEPAIRITRPPPVTEAPTTTPTTTVRTTTRILRLVGRDDEAENVNTKVKRSPVFRNQGSAASASSPLLPQYILPRQQVDSIPMYAPGYPAYPKAPKPVPAPKPEPVPVPIETALPQVPVYSPNPAQVPQEPIYSPNPVQVPQVPQPVPIYTPDPVEIPEPVPVEPVLQPGPVYSPNPVQVQPSIPVRPARPVAQPVFSSNPVGSNSIPPKARATSRPNNPVPVQTAKPPKAAVVVSQNQFLSQNQVFAEAIPVAAVETQAESAAVNPAQPVITATEPTAVEQHVTTGLRGQDNETTVPTSTAEPKPGLIYIDVLSRDIQQGLDGIIKNLPDILKGVKEGLGLLQNIRDIFGEADA